MSSSHDLVVLGSGTAATVAASRVRQAGWSVAVIDHRPIGGTCALRGCDPKKVLVGGAEAIDHARRMSGRGVDGAVRMDWAELMAFKRSFTAPVPAQREKSLRDQGIAVHHGMARFTGPDAIEVAGQRLQGRHFLIATGAEAARLQIRGAEHLATSEQFLELSALPARIVLVGGGFIAAEFSHIAARAGSQVTVLQHGPRMLKGFDAELVGWLMQKFQALGIQVCTGTSVQAVEKSDYGFTVRAASDQGEVSVDADLVVHAAGRVPALQDLDLAAAGIDAEQGRLKLNEYLQSVSNTRVYAAGDAAQAGPPLTPVSGLDAKVVADNLLQGNHRKPDYRGVPSVAFTVPP
jgi:glutathione reductase (NADPH)